MYHLVGKMLGKQLVLDFNQWGGCGLFQIFKRASLRRPPISFVFNPGFKVFSLSFCHLIASGKSQFFKLQRRCPLPLHLLFSDNTLLFLNGNRASIQKVNDFLAAYQNTSGQHINHQKSYFLCSTNLPESRIRSLERLLSMRRGNAGERYLGALLLTGRAKTADYQYLLDKMEKRVSGWKAKLLSQAGRTALIKHVLGSIPLHVLAAAEIPKQVLANLNQCFPRFFWGWSNGRRKLPWIAWKKIARPMEEGGLGIRNLQEVVNAMRMKMA
ncbi:uncharacterized protein LOC131254328 [Magnolia sinica]|uniref:uncharacterized protein LOC131254328 n=1 Tax=Magnolia sinica TaxID=86752 RepID=UPI002658EF33|nr:uncharacterized protein LOC131254328 [Magnolia sinica]